MRTKDSKATRLLALRAVTILSFAAVAAFGQQQINLTAGPTTKIMPDGSSVPMWGYTCGAPVLVPLSTAKCTNQAAGWSPVVITVPFGQGLTINLTNNLSFGGNNVPTSLVIVGQFGGGLGTTAKAMPSPDHSTAQQVTWPIAGDVNSQPPPVQDPRVQSFSTEVLVGTPKPLTWTAANLRAGTYLIESGTHPSIQGPMGLYGMLVVTTAPVGVTAGTAYPGVTYNADLPLLLSEIDPVQNNAVTTAVNTVSFSEIAPWSGQPGKCGDPAVHTCYPPAVNYTPLYYLFNGVAFDKNHASASLFPTSPPTGITQLTGKVLVRFVNAGLRMHVPSIVGSRTGTPAVGGFSLIAEDGNPLPGVSRVQSEVFLAAGKTYDVMINAPANGGSALPVYDRQLSLSGNATARDAGMLAYLGVNSAGTPNAPAFNPAIARNDAYSSVLPCSVDPCKELAVLDPAKGVIANDFNVNGVKVSTPPSPAKGTVTLNTNGTFTFVPKAPWTSATSDTFIYQANGTGPVATVTLSAAPMEASGGITVNDITYTSNLSKTLSIKSPGILSVDKDAAGYPLKVAMPLVATSGTFTSLSVDPSGAFNASVPAPGTYSFTYNAMNSQGTPSASTATVTLIFPTANGPHVKVVDGKDQTNELSDYRWIIEEDRTFYINPNTTTNTGATVPTFGTNFHTSYMPIVAQGCVGSISCEAGQTVQGAPAVCDGGNGVCRTTASQRTAVLPSEVHLDTTKHYYISILPGDGADALANPQQGHAHGMGGSQLAYIGNAWVNPGITPTGETQVKVLVEPSPFQTSKLTVFVFEDDNPLNGEQDAGGGVDILAPNEPGLGGFNITLYDDAGGTGDATGQMTYDMFNQPLSNSLAGTIDPTTGLDACPISKISRIGADDPNQLGITGTIVTCPKYEAGGTVLSPLAGQAVVANMMPGRYGVVATPGADRIGKSEEWLQTNTLDGQKAHDSFLRVGEPSFFQEYGPAGYHVSIGFANPGIIKARGKALCPNNAACPNTIKGLVTTERMSRTPDERLYSSGSHDSFAFSQCYVSVGDTDGEDFAFAKCAGDGSFSVSGIPNGKWRITIFDQWNDLLVDGLSTPVQVSGGQTLDMKDIAINQWQANISTRTFFDTNGNGVSDDGEPGLSLVPTNIRFRDGSFSNFNSTDLNGNAGFNEVFPLFSWYVIETDTTRYKNTGTHVIYDSGGPADGSTSCGSAANPGYPACGTSSTAANMANTAEQVPLPSNLRVPGSVYCSNADCTGFSIKNGPGSSATGSTGRIDPPWVSSYGWQGFSGQNSFLEFGKTPFKAGENGGVHGHVVYASTRPFDDPALLLQLSWEPMVPHVTMNLYQEGTAADGSQSLTLVDTTQTSSFDDWAQGFRSDGVPNMNCPGQLTDTSTPGDLFYFTLFNQPNYLDVYNNGGTPTHSLPNNSQFKCYDGMHNWNQLQPAPYDGKYEFPSIIARNPQTGAATGAGSLNGTPTTLAGTNCAICVSNPVDGTPMLPTGKYVVEVVVPPGYELVKEEDKNILIGDTYNAPTTVQFPDLGGSIYILPDQAAVAAAYNSKNALNPTTNLGARPRHEGDTGSVETFWPCVGQSRMVPDYISLFPGSQEVAPFAGATRNLCDRKEVTLDDQMSVLAKFYVFTSTHVAAHFTGVVTDDFTSEFDPFSPQFGEKFSPPNLPVSIKDWAGNEVSRVYTDQWGAYNGLNYSTWEVNPPNPTGYAPTMMVTCMNDAGTGTTPDPLFNPGYSQFCYELPFMPGQTGYFDTPVTPTSGFSEGYNHPDCSYPDATPAIKQVNGDGIGPWVSSLGPRTLTIIALGDQPVINNAYSGPSAKTDPFNKKTITRHYVFGGTQGTGTVTIGGLVAPVLSWGDGQISVTVPANLPQCGIQQQAEYSGPPAPLPARCGELVITADNGKQSIDAVTVTMDGKAPTHVTAGTSIQSAIDNANPGDLIMVDPGTYNEFLLMWKPVRLQGVGAASSILNANTHPAGKLDPWRRQVNCLFGLALNGQPFTTDPNSPAPNPFDSTGTFTCGGWPGFNAVANNPQVDRLPLEGILGWDTTVNGNLAQLLQEPTLMGAYEGAGITVLAKGVKIPDGSTNVFGSGSEAAFPAGSTLLTAGNCGNGANPYPSNFQCNPSSIDGLSITNSSQGGGGIFVHAWGHNLEVANNRVYNNSGTLTGGITIGQGESPDAYLAGTPADSDPGSCQDSSTPNLQLPYCFDLHVKVHHNSVTLNSSIGDELFSSTPAGAGGVTFCTGADYYQFNYNWVCGNLSTGDGGGVVHLGFIYNGDIEHNRIMFNQSTNPTVPTNGGGLMVMGAPPDGLTAAGLECGNTAADADCVPGLSDGTGPGLVINANLFQGNAADSGSGGGIRLQGVNGTDVVNFNLSPANWNTVSITNNIITNNVAGWDGAGISMQDALFVNVVNNTIASNDSTASSGVLFNTLGAPIASSQGPTCTTNCGSASASQPAGLVTMRHSAVFASALPLLVRCPDDHGTGGLLHINASCKTISHPLLYNDVFWDNRSFYIGVGSTLSPQYQNNVVTLYNMSGTAAPSQPQLDATTPNGSGGGVIVTGGTGACTAASYWDLGVRGDTGPTNHASGFTLVPMGSVLTDLTGYTGSNNTASDPRVLSQYCNGSRTPPELGSAGYAVPPGISDATVPNPVFNLTPSATVDEGNNWINIHWGPLALTNPVNGSTLGNYGPASDSSVVNHILSTANTYALAPTDDFFGTLRKTNSAVDAGAVEFVGSGPAIASVTGGPLAFGNVVDGTTSTAQTLTLHNTGGADLTLTTLAFSSPLYSRPAGAAGGTCTATLTAAATCTINVVFSPTTPGLVNATLTITGSVTVTGSPVSLSGTGIAQTLTATLTPATWTVSQTRNCPGTGLGIIACGLDPSQSFTLTNAGNVPITGIAQGVLGGTNASEFSIVRLFSTCGPAGGGQAAGITNLAPGATCNIQVQFKPLTAQTTGVKSATVSVTDSAGTQTSILTGTAR